MITKLIFSPTDKNNAPTKAIREMFCFNKMLEYVTLRKTYNEY